jgi:Tfp pilus assembly protein PilF
VSAVESRQPGRALESIERAIALDPGRVEYHAQRARCLTLLRRHADAAVAADRAMALEPADALTLDTLGVVYSRIGRHHRAAAAFRAATARAPRNAGFHFNLGASLQFAGDVDGAEAAFEAAIAIAPRMCKAHSALSQLRRQTPERNHLERLHSLLATVGDDVDAALYLHHALAKEYEDLGEETRAFGHLEAGNSLKRRGVGYSTDRDRALFETVERLFDAQVFAGRATGDPSNAPIFVVGMPRTGTTLTERILSAHSRVRSAGEPQDFAIALKRLAGTRSNVVLDVETLERGMQIDFAALGRAYLDSVRVLAGDAPRFVDKMPLNFLYIGFIRLALPNARIVCLRRNALDTCLSNFRQLFALDFSYYDYAYDLLDTGRYYAMFDRLMRHWRACLPGTVLEVRYEALVADLEGEARRILEFCGLPWEPACLAFETNPAPVATASATQVRQPLYSSAVGRWRRYGAALDPLRALLAQHGIAAQD